MGFFVVCIQILIKSTFEIGEYGSRQSPWFCFKPSFWFKREMKLGIDNDGYDGSQHNVNTNIYLVTTTNQLKLT